jgi:hypothetical protein
MELPEVDVIHAKAVERAMQFLTRAFLIAPVALCREKEPPRLSFQPRSDPALGISVGGRGVDVIDAVPKQHFKRLVRDLLRYVA